MGYADARKVNCQRREVGYIVKKGGSEGTKPTEKQRRLSYPEDGRKECFCRRNHVVLTQRGRLLTVIRPIAVV